MTHSKFNVSEERIHLSAYRLSCSMSFQFGQVVQEEMLFKVFFSILDLAAILIEGTKPFI